MAAKIRKELGVEVEQIAGHYGEFTVLVDDAVVSKAGALAFLGVLPPRREVVDQVRARLSA